MSIHKGAFFMPDGAVNTGISQKGEDKKHEKETVI